MLYKVGAACMHEITGAVQPAGLAYIYWSLNGYIQLMCRIYTKIIIMKLIMHVLIVAIHNCIYRILCYTNNVIHNLHTPPQFVCNTLKQF